MKSRVSAAVLLAVACFAQGLAGQQRSQPEATFRVQVEAVELDAVVTDAQGNLVTNLTKDDFQILEDGKPQAITSFALVNIPIERPLDEHREALSVTGWTPGLFRVAAHEFVYGPRAQQRMAEEGDRATSREGQRRTGKVA